MHDNLRNTSETIEQYILACYCLIKLVRLRICSQHKVFPPCWPWVRIERFREACTTISGDNFQQAQSSFVTYRTNLEEVDFAYEEFLDKKTKQQKRLYVDHGVLQKIFQKIHAVKAVRRPDSIELMAS